MLSILSQAFSGSALIFHMGAVLSFVALAFRDQLKLRTVLLFSILMDLIYHLSEDHGPAWAEVFWNVVIFAINLKVLVEITLDRTHIGLSAEQEELFSALGALTPGQFRSLMKLGTLKTAEVETVITTEGVVPESLFYVLQGGIDLHKGSRTFATLTKTFIGEIAYLHNTSASATVSLTPGTRYVEWPVKTLHKELESREDLKHTMMSLIGLDMALKVARA